MKGFIFDIEGKFAHFRKIYTNSSSLSYSVPPRTTIQGILAAVLGYERDSYYNLMDSLFITVRKNKPTYKMTHTLNYIRAESARDLIQPKQHTQIPMEIISAMPMVSYRIYVGADSFPDMQMLKERLKNERYAFPPTLGTAFFLANIHYISDVQFDKHSTNNYTQITSVINTDAVDEIKLQEMKLFKEKMPRAFGMERTLKATTSYYIEDNCRTITVRLKEDSFCWKVNYNECEEYIVFM